MAVFYFVVLALVCRAQAQLDADSLCDKLAQGDFSRINLKSITYYGDERLVLFESSYKYNIPLSSVTSTSLPIGTKKWWDDDEMSEAIKEMKITADEPSAVYMFAFGDPERFNKLIRFGAELLGLNVVTTEGEYMWDIWYWKGGGTELWKVVPPIRPEYAVLGEQNKDNPSGFVVHKDIFSSTPTFVIYDLTFTRSIQGVPPFTTDILNLDIYSNKSSHSELAQVAYYHLEKTEKPDKIRLVHKENYHNPRNGTVKSRALFTRLPVGYKFKSTVFFFDTQLGCVYAVDNLPSPLKQHFASNQDLVLNRKNFAYEDFFRCGGAFQRAANFEQLHPRNRCQTTLLDTPVNVAPITGMPTRIKLAIIGGVIFGMLVLFFTTVICVVMCKIAVQETEGDVSKKKSSKLTEKTSSVTPVPGKSNYRSPWQKVLRQVNKALGNPVSESVQSDTGSKKIQKEDTTKNTPVGETPVG